MPISFIRVATKFSQLQTCTVGDNDCQKDCREVRLRRLLLQTRPLPLELFLALY